MTWLETPSATFVARHEERDAADAAQVLDQLESARARLERLFPQSVGELAVVLHGSVAQLEAAQPWVAVQRRLTAPAGRRYVVGWAVSDALHVLAPRLLARRASNVEGSLELLMLAPVAVLVRRVVAANNGQLPPPLGFRQALRLRRWAWQLEGAAQWFSGQVRHLRPAVLTRLRDGPPPAFPPGARDAALLAGTVYDLLAREEGDAACVELACAPLRPEPDAALVRVFQGRALRHTEAAWRAHLARLGGRPARRPAGG